MRGIVVLAPWAWLTNLTGAIGNFQEEGRESAIFSHDISSKI